MKFTDIYVARPVLASVISLLILAIGLVIISILGEGLVCHRFLKNPLGEGGGFEQRYNFIFVSVMLGIAALNIGAAYFPMKYGIRALEKVEF